MAYRGVVHIASSDRKHGREREDDDNETCPGNADPVRSLADDTIAHVERSRLELHFGMVLEHPSPGGFQR